MLMGEIIVRVIRKFVQVNPHYQDHSFMKDLAHKAFQNNITELRQEPFLLWLASCKPLEDLITFLEDKAARSQPDSNESRMRIEMRVMHVCADKLFERIERLNARLPDFVEAALDTVNKAGR